MEIAVQPGTTRFDEDDERWAAQRAALYGDLRREVGSVRLRQDQADGYKGASETIILALGTAGVFQAATSCFQAWLARDRTRRIELSWTRDGAAESLVVEGRNIDDDTFRRLEAKLEQLGIEP